MQAFASMTKDNFQKIHQQYGNQQRTSKTQQGASNMRHITLLAIFALFANTAAQAAQPSAPDIYYSSSACKAGLSGKHGGKDAVEKRMAQELATFKPLAERALALRAETIKAGQSIKAKVNQDKPLSGDDMAIINQGINEHLELRYELLKLAEAHECWLDIPEKKLGRYGLTRKAVQGLCCPSPRQCCCTTITCCRFHYLKATANCAGC
jgi:hypothetical protein